MKRLSSSLSFSLSFTVACTVAFTPAALAADNNHAYVRFPALHRDTVVFTAEGDLWKTSVQGGIAQRLTTHPGAETHASISRDGQWIAFSATYEGAQEAYVMPIQGGIPQRISFENGQVSVLGWSAQGEVLMSAQHQTGPAAQAIIFKVHPKSLERTVFPVLDANEATLDDNGKFLYFTRLGSHVRGDNVKQYRGGAVAQLWRFDLTSSDQKNTEAVKLFAQEKSNNRRPMLWKNRLIFLSDRDGAMNLYSANLDGSDPRRLTQQQEWDVRNPHISEGKIVYQSGADIRLYDLANQRDQILSLNLISDFDQSRQRYIKNPLEFLSNAQPASKEEKIVVTARGHLSVAGNNMHRRIDITLPKAARARDAVFSHDDKSIYAFVDSTGENEIWRFPMQGNAKPEQLTKEGQFHRLALFPSPDGKYLAHTDKRGRLWLLDLASKENAVIDDAGKIGMGTQDEVVWSADSKTIALTRANSNMGRNQIGLYDLASKQLHFVTTDRFDSESPVFSGDGKWLYFLSNRNFLPGVGAPWGDRNMGTYFD
ncbi:MAG: PD40 domain-containing protein, partial [Burkholderiales bacterium]|nr:PD40 domain-containing protein [Burkholderiales bacterium]